ncbi:hypothetical protein HJFPF1_02738 [Paramyrothecium foliicola]|nr:hypothetical protein HJFPF1_02738 [Paramyrothecium foliicola]
MYLEAVADRIHRAFFFPGGLYCGTTRGGAAGPSKSIDGSGSGWDTEPASPVSSPEAAAT